MCSSDLILILQLSSGPYHMLLVNLYNPPSDNTTVPLLYEIDFPNMPTFICGDFNLHHLDWSRKDAHKTSSGAQSMVEWMNHNNFTLLNNPGEFTWFRKRENTLQQSVLDLTWANHSAGNLVSDWGIRPDLCLGGDHLPYTFTISLFKSDASTPPPKYKPDHEKKEDWQLTLTNLLFRSWKWGNSIPDIPAFLAAVPVLHQAIIQASDKHFSPPSKPPRHSFYWNKHCRQAIQRL